MSENAEDFREVVRREKRLLATDCRADASCLDDLLDPDFVEHGSSGRVWTRAETIEALPADPGVEGTAGDFQPVRLAPDVILLTYRIHGGRASLRSSVWIRDDHGNWRMRFHQGTRTGPSAGGTTV